MYCVKCGVKLQDGVEQCPLCRTPVRNPEPRQESRSYPATLPRQHRESDLPGAVALTVVCAVAAIVTLTVCFKLYGGLRWGGYVVFGLLLFYVVAVLPRWFRQPKIEVFVPIDHAAAALYVLYICLKTGGHWFLSFAFPVILSSCILSTAVVCLLKYVKGGRLFILGGFLLLCGGFTVLVEFFEHLSFGFGIFRWSLYSLAGFGSVGLFLLILRPLHHSDQPVPGLLWVHGGGYQSGPAKDIFATRALSLVVKFGAVLVAPDYRLSKKHPYPAALHDCWAALLYLKEHAEELGVRSDQLMVGGESAGGGMAAALCMLARDRGEVNIAFQMPLHPMLDDRDTPSSADNHAPNWNTKRNRKAWKRYLREAYGTDLVPCYAAPAALDLEGDVVSRAACVVKAMDSCSAAHVWMGMVRNNDSFCHHFRIDDKAGARLFLFHSRIPRTMMTTMVPNISTAAIENITGKAVSAKPKPYPNPIDPLFLSAFRLVPRFHAFPTGPPVSALSWSRPSGR